MKFTAKKEEADNSVRCRFDTAGFCYFETGGNHLTHLAFNVRLAQTAQAPKSRITRNTECLWHRHR